MSTSAAGGVRMVMVIRRGKHKCGTWSEENEHTRKRHASIYARKNCKCHCKRRGTSLRCLLCSPDMHHYLQRETAYDIARGEEPPYGGLYAPPTHPCVPNPPDKKATRKDKPSSSHRKNDWSLSFFKMLLSNLKCYNIWTGSYCDCVIIIEPTVLNLPF
jgi:hypothetical protein